MLTIKLKYKIDNIQDMQLIKLYIRQYNSVYRVFYNLLRNETELKTKYDYYKQNSICFNLLNTLNNVNLIKQNSIILQNCIANAHDSVKANYEIQKKDKTKLNKLENQLKFYIKQYKNETNNKPKKYYKHKISKLQHQITYIQNKKYINVFGGKKLFSNYTKQFNKSYKGNKISKTEFINKRLTPLKVNGHKLNNGNRFFKLNDDLQSLNIRFKPGKLNNIKVDLINISNYNRRLIKKLYDASVQKLIPITYSIDNEYIYISYEEGDLNKYTSTFNRVKNRICAIDMNPNYLGWSIVDWKSSDDYKIIASGVYNLKDINDEWFKFNDNGLQSNHPYRLHNHNKRLHEIYEISNNLIHKMNYYRVELFSYEKLEFIEDDKCKGKNVNTLCNNLWCRERMIQNIISKCNIHKIKYVDVLTNYSSVYGNIIFRECGLPDMSLSSMEIGRRGYEFYNQYIRKEKLINNNIIHPNSQKLIGFGVKALEVFGFEQDNVVSNIYYLYRYIIENDIKYRVNIDGYRDQMVRFLSLRSRVKVLTKSNFI